MLHNTCHVSLYLATAVVSQVQNQSGIILTSKLNIGWNKDADYVSVLRESLMALAFSFIGVVKLAEILCRYAYSTHRIIGRFMGDCLVYFIFYFRTTNGTTMGGST